MPDPTPSASPACFPPFADLGPPFSGVPLGSPCRGGGAIISGDVFGPRGEHLAGAGRVQVQSTTRDAPYLAAVDLAGGHYVVNGVRTCLFNEVVATLAGGTTRRRVVPIDAEADGPHVVNFGALADRRDEPGAPFFLAPQPEIERLAPLEPEGARGRVRLVVSEALPAAGRARLAAALRVWGPGGTYDEGLRAAWQPRYPLDVSLAAASARAMRLPIAVSWEGDGRSAILTFAWPPTATRDGHFATWFAVALEAGDEPIHDHDGHVLGTDAAGRLDHHPPAGRLVPGVFLRPAFDTLHAPGLPSGSPEAAWAATHLAVTAFAYPPRPCDAETNPRTWPAGPPMTPFDTSGPARWPDLAP